MDPLLVSVLSTYGPAALIALLVGKWLGGWALGKIFPPKPAAPVPGVAPGTPVSGAGSDHPLLNGLFGAAAKVLNWSVPADLRGLHPDVLTQLRSEIDRLLPQSSAAGQK